MTKSESIKEIAKALSTFQGNIEKIKKDASNPFFKSKYASLSNILDAIQAPLLASGLAFTQMPVGKNELCTILMHSESGEYFESTYQMPCKDESNPQALGSSITYARRYSLASILGLNIDEDDDANKATELPYLNENSEQFYKVLEAYKSGKANLQYIKSKFKLSKEIESKYFKN